MTARGESLVLISPTGSILRAEASIPTTAWRELDFDDIDWKTAPPVSASATAATTRRPDFGACGGFPSVFLRKRFTVEHTEQIKALVLRVDYDDGFVAYLNGTEIARRGLPGEADQRFPSTPRRRFIPVATPN